MSYSSLVTKEIHNTSYLNDYNSSPVTYEIQFSSCLQFTFNIHV